MTSAAPPLLRVENLRTHFPTSKGTVRAVDSVSFDIPAGTGLGIVGESGSGKSMTAMSVIGLLDPPGFIAGGAIRFKGTDLVTAPATHLRSLRGREIGLVLQDPMTALNPVHRVGDQIVEAIRTHQRLTRHAARQRAVELLAMMHIPEPRRRFAEYPHRLSGGMRQRVVIAMALANDPDLLILDEPTTALDMTVQAQILDLMTQARERTNSSVMLISHDIGVVAQLCDQVIVMYGGQVMERAPTSQIMRSPRHPYSQGLLGSAPTVGLKGQRLKTIAGSVPAPLAMPPGCPFANRCEKVMPRCVQRPPTYHLDDGHDVACWLYEGAT